MYINCLGLFFKEKGQLYNYIFSSIHFTADKCILEHSNDVLLSIGFDNNTEKFFFYHIKNGIIILLKLINKIDIGVLWEKIDIDMSEYKQYSYLFDHGMDFLENLYSDDSGECAELNSDLEY